MLSYPAVAIALLGLVGITIPARANDIAVCPSDAVVNADYPFTTSGCAATITVSNLLNYSRLMWDSTVPGYPAVDLGELGGVSAGVTNSGAGQPYYMLAFTDSTDGLGQTNAADQILMLEFQATTTSGVGGDTLAVDPNATLFNLYDNSVGCYLQANGHGCLAAAQQQTNTLDGWLTADTFLAGEAVQQVRIGIGYAGGSGPSETLTVNSLDISTTPEPATLGIAGAGFAALGLLRRRRR